MEPIVFIVGSFILYLTIRHIMAMDSNKPAPPTMTDAEAFYYSNDFGGHDD